MITNGSYLEGLIHRGMRSILARACSHILVVDLHGDSNVGESPPAGVENDNVFDIQQGVAISVFLRSSWLGEEPARVLRVDLWGSREEKYRALAGRTGGAGGLPLSLSEPYWFFAPKDLDTQREQTSWAGIDTLFYVGGMGVKSRRDHFLIDESRSTLRARMSELASCDNVERLRSQLEVTDNPQWTLARMRDLLRREGVEKHLRPIVYRPFDIRFVWYHREAIERGDARWAVMKHVLPNELSLLTSRQSRNQEFSSALVARGLSEMKAAESTRGSYAFPVYRQEDAGPLAARDRTSNIRRERFGPTLAKRSPEEILAYIYAILYSSEYRRRYAGALRIEFPKVPTVCPAALVDDLSRLGVRLISNHLMEASERAHSAISYVGPDRPNVERVGWSNDTVWLDAPVARKGTPAQPGTVGFHGVPEDVWKFQIGGYHVCEKWLKERSSLSKEEVVYYQNVVGALAETIRLMGEIDETIARHGGWPAAFETAAATTTVASRRIGQPSVISLDDRRVKQEAFKTLLPLSSIRAAAGYLGDGQAVEAEGWIEVDGLGKLDERMFIARAVGRSMEPRIHDGDFVVFRSSPVGSRQDKIVLATFQGCADPETGWSFTVKKYSSEKRPDSETDWRHTRIELLPLNPDFKPIVVPEERADDFRVLAEFVAVLGR